jgi:hypothetical protein
LLCIRWRYILILFYYYILASVAIWNRCHVVTQKIGQNIEWHLMKHTTEGVYRDGNAWCD